MPQPRLQHYLRTYRRRFGLSQAEVAYLLGASSDAKVSRYERFARTPSAATVFAYQVIFGAPSDELFAGTFDAIRRDVRERAKRLADSLAKGSIEERATRKLALLRAIVEAHSDPELAA